jgi:hypothetical protein
VLLDRKTHHLRKGERQERLSELVNKKNTGVQEFRSSGFS